MNLEEYEEIICGGLVAAGGLGLMAIMFIFGHVGNAVAAAKAQEAAKAPAIVQTYQANQSAHMAPGILSERNSSGYMYSTAASVTSRFGQPRQF